MKQFGQYSEATRTKAIATLAGRGIHVWDSDFDQNSERVLLTCALIEAGASGMKLPEVPLYTWSPKMVTEYQNSVDGMPGQCLCHMPGYYDYAIPAGWEAH